MPNSNDFPETSPAPEVPYNIIDLNKDLDIGWLMEISYQQALNHGWHEERRTFGDFIALMHSELSEALEDHRAGHKPTEIYFAPELSPLRLGDRKPCGIPIELADAVIRIADYCGLMGIDLDAAIKQKLAFNETRPYRHGGKAL